MRSTRRTVLGSTVTLATGLAGCTGGQNGTGGGDGDDGADDSPTPSPTDESTPTASATPTDTASATSSTSSTDATVRVRSHPELGEILVGPDGRTLYMFDPDTRGSGASSCSGSCAEAWPPLTVDGEPTQGDGVTAELTTFERDGGETQVAAGGWPLYYYVDDAGPGDANGQGVNGVWWVLGPDGTPKRSESTPTPTPTSSGGGTY